MRSWWLPLVLIVPAFTGCLSFLEDDDSDRPMGPPDVGYDASKIEVTGVHVHDLEVESFDNVTLQARVYEPLSAAGMPDGSAPKFPILLVGHPWATAKEFWENLMFPSENGQMEQVNLLDELAQAGFITVAWDARGFGRSGGEVGVAGPAELADINELINFAEDRFPSNGKIGILGLSYGAGQGLLAAATNDRIDAVAAFQGWTDLYDGIAPGNVPKLEWNAVLVGTGGATSMGQVSPVVASWIESLVRRDNLNATQAQMALRSSQSRLANDDTPLFVCQGMQESLFPQIDRAATGTMGLTKAVVHQGGHLSLHRPCYDGAIEWFKFFLAGIDTKVDGWPALETVDAAGGLAITYKKWPETQSRTLYLHDEQIARTAAPNSEFTISQRIIANPFTEPEALWDFLGQPHPVLPNQFRQDPSGVTFQGLPAQEPDVLLGAPTATLELAGNATLPFQVTAQLYQIKANGASFLLARTGAAAVEEHHIDDGRVSLKFPWVKSTIEPGDALSLKLSGNDPGAFLPLLANYSTTFTGNSTLTIEVIP